ncbi:MAG TPA: BamA/TamA family outer membrane protein [Kofleriaceae bacterium]|nr:BamA/TamA family outer membrane protein [Kofleriaceae bacterium]
MRLVQGILAAVAGTAFIADPAHAQSVAATDPGPAPPADRDRRPPVPTGEQPQPPQRHSARTVAGAPTSDRASGIARPEPIAGEGRRAIARGLLVLPRVAFWAVNAPIRAGSWVSERYQVPLRVREALFNPEGTAGLVPLAWAETGYGAGGGARFFHRDVLGRGEHLVAAVSHGGRTEPGAALWIDTGHRLGERLRLRADGRFEERPRDRFHGIGNADEVEEVRFQQRVGLLGAAGELRVAGPLAVRLSSEARWRRIDAGEDRTLGTHQVELALDTRDRPSRAEPPGPRATGLAVSAFAGLASDPVHARLGGQASAHLPLGGRQRILVLRLLADGVSGSLDEIAFVDLPSLGGTLDLRGYPADRFRDRARALTSAEYRFDLGDSFGAFLFADAGRVLSHPSQLADGGLRVGYGGGLDLRRGDRLLGRLSLASSIDGGLFVSAAFDPLGEPEGRR